MASHDKFNRPPRRRLTSNDRIPPEERPVRQRGESGRSKSRQEAQAQRPRKQSNSAERGGSKRRRRVGLLPAALLAAERFVQSPLIPIIGGLLVLVICAAVGWYVLTNKNAIDIYVDEVYITSIAMDRDVTESWIYESALAKMRGDLGANVIVDHAVRIVPSNRRRSEIDSVDHAISAVHTTFQGSAFQLEAADIVVNGTVIVTLRNETEALSVLDTVMLSHVQPALRSKVVSKEFVDDEVEVVPRLAEMSELDSPERAFAALTYKTETESMYQIRGGDTVWHIAQRYGVSQTRLIELNPTVPEVANGNIKAGQMIKVVTLKPLVSVRTLEETVYDGTVSPEVELRPIATRPVSYERVIQEGRDGMREVTGHLERINGIEVATHEISSKVIIQPLTRIVEVGTQ